MAVFKKCSRQDLIDDHNDSIKLSKEHQEANEIKRAKQREQLHADPAFQRTKSYIDFINQAIDAADDRPKKKPNKYYLGDNYLNQKR